MSVMSKTSWLKAQKNRGSAKTPPATSRMYKSVNSTQNSDTQANCMCLTLSFDTWVHIQYRTGCLEKCLSRPPVTCRHAWHDSEYSHSKAAFTTSTSVPRPM